jgi:PIN like domain
VSQPEQPSEDLVYLLDADLLGVAKPLALIRSDVIYPGHARCPTITPDTKDRIWLPEAGRRRLVVIQRDKRIRSRPGERQALLDHGLRTFCLTRAGHMSKWEILRLLVISWPDIERIARELEGPYIYSVTGQGVRPLLRRPTETQ